MNNSIVISARPLSVPWETSDPFLFCMYHNDYYPQGNENLGPAASLQGRNIGQDFEGKDGWRMYHGSVVPGFPQHPHRGFETVTIMRHGYVDHSDSLGATARFGPGDVQWLTAGRGIVHSEMFPLLHQDGPNPLELFQIWLNLPSADKFVEPHFAMLWDDNVPRHTTHDEAGRPTEITVVAGRLGNVQAAPPPPKSWAARPDTGVAIWTIKMAPQARWTMPPAAHGTSRTLYFFRGNSLWIGGGSIQTKVRGGLAPRAEVGLPNRTHGSELLLVPGRPVRGTVGRYRPLGRTTLCAGSKG